MTTSQIAICAGIKTLGFTQGKQVRLYGAVFDLLSDPFCVGDDCIFIDTYEQKADRERRVRIPRTIVDVARERSRLA